MQIRRAAAIILCIVFIALCLTNPAAFVSAGTDGLNLLYRAVLPVLFPFFFISGFIINMSPNGSRHGVLSAVLLSLFSGYPNGARLAGELYARGEIDETRARNLCIYTSTPSPIFAAVSVGTVMLGSTILGVLIFTATAAGAVLNGLLWCGRGGNTSKRSHGGRRRVFAGDWLNPQLELNSLRVDDTSPQNASTGPAAIIRALPAPPPLLKVFNQSLSGAVTAVFNVCGVILIFYIAVFVFNAPPLLSGIIEMTTGANAISAIYLPAELRAMLICFVVSFGGLSVAMQSFIFMREYNMPPLDYFAFKFTHAVLSTAVLALILLL